MQHDEVFKGCDVTYVPIFLGGLMHKVSSEMNRMRNHACEPG